MDSSIMRRLRVDPADNRPTRYWVVEWSHDTDRHDGAGQYFVGPDAEQEARAFARRLRVDPRRGYVKIKDVTPP